MGFPAPYSALLMPSFLLHVVLVLSYVRRLLSSGLRRHRPRRSAGAQPLDVPWPWAMLIRERYEELAARRGAARCAWTCSGRWGRTAAGRLPVRTSSIAVAFGTLGGAGAVHVPATAHARMTWGGPPLPCWTWMTTRIRMASTVSVVDHARMAEKYIDQLNPKIMNIVETEETWLKARFEYWKRGINAKTKLQPKNTNLRR